MSKSCWDVGQYAHGCRSATDFIFWYQYLLVFWFFYLLCDIMLDCLLHWDGSWNGKHHNMFIGNQQSSIKFAYIFLLSICVSKTRQFIHSHTIAQLKWDCHVRGSKRHHQEIYYQFVGRYRCQTDRISTKVISCDLSLVKDLLWYYKVS